MNFAVRVALLGAFALLSACGGGGDGARGAPPPVTTDPPPAGTRLTGVVAVGAPLAGATVDTLCGNGEPGPSASTDAQGKYEMLMAETCATPWLLRASGSGEELFSFGGWQSPAGVPFEPPSHINITPITTLLVERVTFQTMVIRGIGELQTVGDRWRTLDPGAFDTALQQLVDRVNGWRPAGTSPMLLEGILYQPFDPKPGDTMDDFLERVKAMQGSVSTSALLEQAMQDGGNLASGNPWKTLFGSRTSLAFTGTGCQTAYADPADDVSVTLRMQDKDLQVEMAWSGFDAVKTFTVGPAGRSDFQMRVKGGSEFVDVTAWAAGGHTVQLFSDAGVPKLSFNYGTGGATCTLGQPVRRADLASFAPAARIVSVVPAGGTSGSCNASPAGPAYTYEITPMGDVRLDGTSLPQDWLDAPHAIYTESLQYGMGDPGPSYQVLVRARPSRQALQPYYFRTVPYAMDCTSVAS